MNQEPEKTVGQDQIEDFAKQREIDPQILEELLKSGGALVIPKPTEKRVRRYPKRTGGGKVPRKPDADGNPT